MLALVAVFARVASVGVIVSYWFDGVADRSIQAAVDDLLGRSRILDTATQIVLHGETSAALEVRGEAAAQVLLPACA